MSITEKLIGLGAARVIEKLETLVDEATLLVREERARRSRPAVDLFGPRGTEIRWPQEQPHGPNDPNPRISCGGNGVLDTPPVIG